VPALVGRHRAAADARRRRSANDAEPHGELGATSAAGASCPTMTVSHARTRLEGSPITVHYREFEGAHWVDPAVLPTLRAAVDAALA